MKNVKTAPACPCQSGLSYKQCCRRFIEGTHTAETAEQLMRSRYSAYVKKDTDYLLLTWHPDYRPVSLNSEDLLNHWIGLKIKHTHQGTINDSIGKVHFIARFKINGKAHKLEENSSFEKTKGHWFYLTGKEF